MDCGEQLVHGEGSVDCRIICKHVALYTVCICICMHALSLPCRADRRPVPVIHMQGLVYTCLHAVPHIAAHVHAARHAWLHTAGHADHLTVRMSNLCRCNYSQSIVALSLCLWLKTYANQLHRLCDTCPDIAGCTRAMSEPDIEGDASQHGDEAPGDGEGAYAVVTGAVKLTKSGKPCRSWFFSADETKTTEDAKLFLKINTNKSNIRAVLTHTISDLDPRKSHEALGSTDVIDQLLSAKNKKRNSLMSLADPEPAAEDGKYRRPPRSKEVKQKRLLLPEHATIDAPAICGVPGMSMNALMTPAGGKGHGLWLELLPENMEYLIAATAKQYEAGGVTKPPHGHKKRQREEDSASPAAPPDDSGQLDMAADDSDEVVQEMDSTEPAESIVKLAPPESPAKPVDCRKCNSKPSVLDMLQCSAKQS
jgi:hypothetical protein